MLLKNKTLWFAFLFLVLSISLSSAGPSGFGKIDIESNCPSDICTFFDNPNGVWVFEWTDTGFTSDKVLATFDSNDLEAETGAEVDQDFEIGIEGTENYCMYDVKREADRLDIKTMDLERYTKSFWAWEYDNKGLIGQAIKLGKDKGCIQLDDYTYGLPGALIIRSGLSLKDEVETLCWQERDNLGKIGSLEKSKEITETRFKLKADGRNDITRTISNSQTGSGKTSKLGDDALIQWLGLLSSGEECPDTDRELTAFSTDYENNWRVIDRENYGNYENFIRSELDSIASNVFEKKTSLDDAEFLINSRAIKAIAERDISGKDPVVSDSSFSNGQLRVDLDRRISYPRFRLFVDSDYLTLKIPSGEPKVTCPSGVKLNEGDAGILEIGVKNVGDSAGGFNVRIKDCGDGASPGDGLGITLAKGESKNVNLKITGRTIDSNNQEGKCTVELKESTTQQTDTCNFGFKIEKPTECEIGRVWCSFSGEQSVIKECLDGTEKTREYCSEDEICDSDDKGNPICRMKTPWDKTPGDETNECKWYDVPCKVRTFFGGIADLFSGAFGFLVAIRYLLIFIGGIFTLLGSYNIFGAFQVIEDKTAVKWILASVTGLFVVYILYLFIGSIIFWIASIGILLAYIFYNMFFSDLVIYKNLRKLTKNKKR